MNRVQPGQLAALVLDSEMKTDQRADLARLVVAEEAKVYRHLTHNAIGSACRRHANFSFLDG